MQKALLFILSLVVAACSAERARHATLCQAEQLVDAWPDSVVLLLAPINPDTLSDEADRALYGLLFAEALHGSGSLLADDSLINESRLYYERQGDDRRMARALLQQGIVSYGQQHYQQAVILLKQAELQAAGSDDTAWKFLLFSTLGDVNDNANNYPEATRYYRLALAAARQSSDTSRIVRAMNNLTTTYEALGQPDSAASYIAAARPLLERTRDEVRATALVNEAGWHLMHDRRHEATLLLDAARRIMPTDRGSLLEGNISAAEGQWAQAIDAWLTAMSSFSPDIRTQAMRNIVNYQSRYGHSDAALAVSRQLNDYYAQLLSRQESAAIVDMQARFDRDQRQHQQWRQTVWMLVVILTLAVLTAAALAYIVVHRQRVARLHQQIEALQQRYMSWHIDERLLSAEPVSRMHRTATRGQAATTAEWDALYALLRHEAPDFMARLNAAAVLTPKELNVCVLIRLHFIPSELAVLTATSPQTVTNMRVRLLQKLFHAKGGARDFDARMQQL